MKLEDALKYLSPQSVRLSNTSRSTALDRVTRADVLAALSATGKHAPLGLAVFMGKAGLNPEDARRAEQALVKLAMECAPKNVRKGAGKALPRCMLTLAQFAFAEYARSAAQASGCPTCEGKGYRLRREEVVKYPGLRSHHGTEIVAPMIREETVPVVCDSCHGKGTISARCRCRGTGRVLDRLASKAQGREIYKTCARCAGKGFISPPSTAVYKAILRQLPELHVRTWTRNWRPFFESLVAKCDMEEQRASAAFHKQMSSQHANENKMQKIKSTA